MTKIINHSLVLTSFLPPSPLYFSSFFFFFPSTVFTPTSQLISPAPPLPCLLSFVLLHALLRLENLRG